MCSESCSIKDFQNMYVYIYTTIMQYYSCHLTMGIEINPLSIIHSSFFTKHRNIYSNVMYNRSKKKILVNKFGACHGCLKSQHGIATQENNPIIQRKCNMVTTPRQISTKDIALNRKPRPIKACWPTLFYNLWYLCDFGSKFHFLGF